MAGPDRRQLLADAVATLTARGVPSPEHDAAELLAHVLGTTRPGLVLHDRVSPRDAATYADLVTRRAARVPLQHLTGVAYFRHVELAVGPGVFVPRPETELLAGWAVELDEGAFAWAARNLAGTGVDLRLGDLAEAFDDLVGSVDVVVCNPPYIPLEAWESVAPEARDHDPAAALWSGNDGLDTLRVLERRAALLLRPGGVVGAEHADVQGASAPDVFRATDRWLEIRDHHDLADRPRFLTARLRG